MMWRIIIILEKLLQAVNGWISLMGKYPQHAEVLIAPLLNDPAEFKRLIETSDVLISLVEKYPQHADALINRLLQDPKEFKRVVTDSRGLESLKNKYPKHNEILSSPSVEDALKKLEINQDMVELKKNARLLGLLHKREDSLFSILPPEIAQKIIRDTRSSIYLSDKDADQIFYQEYDDESPRA